MKALTIFLLVCAMGLMATSGEVPGLIIPGLICLAAGCVCGLIAGGRR